MRATDKHWTEEELEWIRKNYQKITAKEGGIKFRISASQYTRKKLEIGLRNNKDHHDAIHMDLLTNMTDPDIAYLLGFIWADGYIRIKQTKKEWSKLYIFAMDINEADGIELTPLMNKLGMFHIRHESFQGPNGDEKRRVNFDSSDQKFTKFLYDHDYLIKSQAAPIKILNHIPLHLHAAFWYGYFDGDGCLCIDKNNKARFFFTGSSDQCWDAVIRLFESLKLTWHIYQRSNKRSHHWSTISLAKRTDVEKIMSYLFSTATIGLQRKREKFTLLQEMSA